VLVLPLVREPGLLPGPEPLRVQVQLLQALPGLLVLV